MRILILLLSVSLLCGCATPGVMFDKTDTGIKITPVENEGFLSWLFPANLPAGDYEYQASENEKASFSTKADMKLIDLNMLKDD